MSASARDRAAARAGWPIRRAKLGDDDASTPAESSTASERFARIWAVTLDAWALSGAPLPTYTRAETPGRVVRGRDRPDPVTKK
jgi:hypothetical protein